MMTPETALLTAIAIPLIGGAGILMTGKVPNLREAVTLITGVALTYVVVGILLPVVMAGGRPEVSLGEMLPGLSISFALEPLGMIFACIASFLWVVTSIYSIGYMRGHHEKNQTRFYFFFAVAIFAAMGLTFSGNMLTLFIFYEVLTLSTFPLVTHAGTEDAKKGGRVYLGILIGSSIAFLFVAIIWTYVAVGTLDFSKGGILEGHVSDTVAGILLALYVFGIGKAALMPLHRWLPAAMVAPTPVSALLHAVAVVKAGVFTVLKVTIYIFGIDYLKEIGVSEWLQYMAAATIILASLVAMTKDNLKARLAYSTVSQLSYIVLAAMLVTDSSIIGGGMHIVTHAFGKITLFFCAGAILVAAHKSEISQMRGLGRVMPLTFICFFIGSLSIIGLPPFGGLWSKWYIAVGAMEAQQVFFVGVLMLSSLLNVGYLLPIPIRAFFGPRAVIKNAKFKEAPVACLIAIGISSIGCVLLFFYPSQIYALLKTIVVP
jgi:multicomponent Na+:H+ antiporter subunit D